MHNCKLTLAYAYAYVLCMVSIWFSLCSPAFSEYCYQSESKTCCISNGHVSCVSTVLVPIQSTTTTNFIDDDVDKIESLPAMRSLDLMWIIVGAILMSALILSICRNAFSHGPTGFAILRWCIAIRTRNGQSAFELQNV